MKNQEQRLDCELDFLYRFAGTVGSNLEAVTLLADARPQLLSMAGADKIVIAIITEEQPLHLEINQLGWDNYDKLQCNVECLKTLDLEAQSGVGSGSLPETIAGVFPTFKGAWALIPLSAYGKNIGLILFTRDKEPFSFSDLKLLNTAGRQLAIAAQNVRLFGDLQKSYMCLMAVQEEVIRSERLAAIGGLAATMAHEIRTPLTTILSSLSQIRKHARLKGDADTLLKIAEEESLRLNTMVGGLLEFARPKAPRLGEVNPVEITNEVIGIAMYRSDYPSNVKLSIGADSQDITARLDPELFRQALQHLIWNSLAAVDPESGRVTVEIKVDSEDLMVVVDDNGSGIETELQTSIFEPFFSTKPLGTGLGLPVVKRIIEDHNGELELDSSPGNGTRIKLLFKKSIVNKG